MVMKFSRKLTVLPAFQLTDLFGAFLAITSFEKYIFYYDKKIKAWTCSFQMRAPLLL